MLGNGQMSQLDGKSTHKTNGMQARAMKPVRVAIGGELPYEVFLELGQ